MIEIIIAGLIILLANSLAILGRLREWHHGYYGIAAALVGVWASLSFLVWIGLVLLIDDDVQHVWEAIVKLSGHVPPGDFTPIHRIGSWLLSRFDQKAA